MYLVEIIGFNSPATAFPVDGCEAAWALWRKTADLLEDYARVLLIWNETGEIIADSKEEE